MLTLQSKEIISATNLFVFNPEHDLALAVGNCTYTAPAEVVKLRKELSLLPALYVDNSDFIILPDEVNNSDLKNLKFFNLAVKKNLKLIHFHELGNLIPQYGHIFPWGWDFAIYNQLIKNGIPHSLLPSFQELNKIRELSHRRIAIKFREKIVSTLGLTLLNPSWEINTLIQVEEFLKKNPIAYFKAPWSSSGRGIIVSDHISYKGLVEWTHGVIKKQGSVIVEPAWNRILDFATEWWIKNGEPIFMGYSVFETSSRGKYHGNLSGTQEELLQLIKNKAPNFRQEIIDVQKNTIHEMIAPFYSGPLGIDMFADSKGNINHCVEINLRFTMGLINLDPIKFF